MQKEEGRMMKAAHSQILHSSFILLNFPVPASHYFMVMLDQIGNRHAKTGMIRAKWPGQPSSGMETLIAKLKPPCRRAVHLS
jgi:hypothetical protein